MNEALKHTMIAMATAALGFRPVCCHACNNAGPRDEHWNGMIICPTCGNKRCPHANNHENACTRSNEPGQAGSAYP